VTRLSLCYSTKQIETCLPEQVSAIGTANTEVHGKGTPLLDNDIVIRFLNEIVALVTAASFVKWIVSSFSELQSAVWHI
jgi:hypothetical protein